MKLLNIFKKESENSAITPLVKLDKNQLAKVIGGSDSTDTTITSTDTTQNPKKIDLNTVKERP